MLAQPLECLTQEGFYIDSAGRLYVADLSNNRVLVYNSIPTVSGAAPDYVVGQPDFTTCTSVVSATQLSAPGSVHVQGGYLFVANANRVSVFSYPVTSNGPTSVRILGQTGPTGNTVLAPPTLSSLGQPGGVSGDGTRIFVSDTGNNRVLIWNSLPGADGGAASTVLGQANGISALRNSDGVSASSLLLATAVQSIRSMIFSDGTQLLAADPGNNRILVWNTIPTTDNAPADQVIGQPNFSVPFAGGFTDGSQCVNTPVQLAIANVNGVEKLLVTSGSANNGRPYNEDNRVLVWDKVPTATFTNSFSDFPKLAIGQPSLQTNQESAFAAYPYTAVALTAADTAGPMGVAWSGSQLFVSDLAFNRVLAYSEFPTQSGASATGVVGQPSFQVVSASTSATKLSTPHMIGASSQALAIADSGNNRVLVFSPPPDSYSLGASASVVLGQTIMSSSTPNAGGVSASSLSNPRGVAVWGNRIIVSDRGNNRVLIWNSIPTQNGQAADLVLGQPDMFSNSSNNGGISASSLYVPMAPWTDGKYLVIADTGNHRILVWKNFPTVNQAPADWVYGQTSFATRDSSSTLGLSHQTLQSPWSALISGKSIYIADTGNHRILTFPLPE